MADLNERDAKLVQWLTEAHTKESELEADLTAHIGLTQKQSYKNRLRKHLTETRDHKRRVASRVKQLGGSVDSGPSVTGAVTGVAGKTVAAVKGQVGVMRAVVTEQAETHLRNAQEELREEHVEIAMYKRIETFATEVGDRDTARLAKAIRRDEERMAKFLDAEMLRLVKDVVRAEVPRQQRQTRSSRSSTRRSGSSSRSSSSGRSSSSSGRSSSGRSSASASRSGSSSGRSASSSSRSGSSGRSGSSSGRSGSSSGRSSSSSRSKSSGRSSSGSTGQRRRTTSSAR